MAEFFYVSPLGPWQHAVTKYWIGSTLCSADGAPFLAQRVGGIVLMTSSIFYVLHVQHTSMYVRDTRVFLAMPCLMVQPREMSCCDCFPSHLYCDQQDQLAHVVYTMTVFRDHSLSCHMAAAI
jgi:hypothetical protein